MTLCIDRNTRLIDIQKWFSGEFCFLKLEFFKPSLPHDTSSKKEMRNPSEPALGKDRQEPAVISIDSSWTVMNLEEEFLKAGLHVQVFRKSGNLWIETSLTNDWTLEQQNYEGELFSSSFYGSIGKTANRV